MQFCPSVSISNLLWVGSLASRYRGYSIQAIRGTCGTCESWDFRFWARSSPRTGWPCTGWNSFPGGRRGTSGGSVGCRGGSRRRRSSAGKPRCWPRTDPPPTDARAPWWRRRRRRRRCEEGRRGKRTPPASPTPPSPTPRRPPPPLPSRSGCTGPGGTPPPGPPHRGNGAGRQRDGEPHLGGVKAPAAWLERDRRWLFRVWSIRNLLFFTPPKPRRIKWDQMTSRLTTQAFF